MNSNKRGQVEILGLAILVILLVVILVIALKFSFTSDNSANNELRSGLIANNLLNAIIKEKTKVDIKDLIYECYFGIKKGSAKEISCSKLSKEINKIISLNIGNRNFEIIFSTDSSEFFREGKCVNGVQSTAYRFKKEDITFVGTLKICD